jgi:chromosome segregation ATPase
MTSNPNNPNAAPTHLAARITESGKDEYIRLLRDDNASLRAEHERLRAELSAIRERLDSVEQTTRLLARHIGGTGWNPELQAALDALGSK